MSAASYDDRLTDAAADDVAAALMILLDRAAASVDLMQIAAVIDNADDDTSHGIEQLNTAFELFDGRYEPLDPAIDPDAPGSAIAALFGLFAAAASTAASEARHVLNTAQARYTAPRDEYAGQGLRQFIIETATALTATISRNIDAAGDATSRAKHIRRSVGLTMAQAQTLEAMRRVLLNYQANVISISDEAARQKAIRSLLATERGRFSAPQSAALTKTMTAGVNATATETLLDRHAKAMRDHRIKVTAQQAAHSTSEYARLTGWQIAQFFGALPTDARREWETAGDEAVRHSHAEVAAMNPGGVALDQPFETPFGPAMSAPLEINCRCRARLVR